MSYGSLFLLIFFLISQQLHADMITLFDTQGNQVKNYDKLIKEIKIGDVFKFSDGSQFIYESVLGKGTLTVIFKVKPLQKIAEVAYNQSLALRLPLKYGTYVSGRGLLGTHTRYYTESIDAFIKGQQSIEKIATIKMPKIYASLKSQYAAVELINYDFDGFTFFAKSNQVDAKILNEAELALEKFVEDTAKFTILDDFHPGQMVYNKEQKAWYLIDWAASNHGYTNSIFKDFRRHPFNREFFQILSISTDKKSNPIYFIWPQLLLRRSLSKRELALFHKIYKMTVSNRKCLVQIAKSIAK